MKKVIPFHGNFPLSHAIIHDHLYTAELSGSIWVDPYTNELESGIENQTKRILDTIKETLEGIWWTMKDLVKVKIFMSDMSEYARMNTVYASYFETDFPARIVVWVHELPRKALIEIECTASSEKVPK